MKTIKDLKSIVIIDKIDRTKEIEGVSLLNNYVKIKFFGNDKIYTYKSDRIELKNNYSEYKKTKDIIAYFSEEAKSSPIKIEKDDVSLLKKYFDEIGNVTSDMILSYFLCKRPLPNRILNKVLIYPFGINLSQRQAVENAFKSPISIIQGPPGTGKTQTILNIIANIILEGKSIAVVSNNNSAVMNIADKLKNYNLDFLVASLGSKQKKEIFIESQSTPDLSGFNCRCIDANQKISESLKIIDDILTEQNKLSELRQLKEKYILEYKYFKSICNNKIEKSFENKWNGLSSTKLFEIWSYCNTNLVKKIKLKHYLYFLYHFGFRYLFFKNKNIFHQIENVQNLFYKNKLQELEIEINQKEQFLKKNKLEYHLRLLEQISMQFLKYTIYQKMHGKKRKQYTLKDVTYMHDEFVADYPIVLSTLFSLKNICNGNFLFDYLIVDEASQADLLTSTLAMSCAKNIIVVGDIQQLPNVITDEVAENSIKILKNYHIDPVYHFHKNSLLSSIIKLYPNAPNVLLKEHYRCHPKIIGFCNDKFYDNQLIVLKNNDKSKDTLRAIRTPPGNHARGHVNQRQIDIIKEEILPYLNEKYSIGIISPYRKQVEALRENLPSNIEIDTIHKFQGREKDIIIFSTVDNTITDFIDNANLINVAVSRAKKKLWIVYSGDNLKNSNLADLINYIRYNNFEVKMSNVYSIFDLLYSEYTEKRVNFLKSHKSISKYASENIAYECIKTITDKVSNNIRIACGVPLKFIIKLNDNYTKEERNFIMRGSHVDFLIYNKMSKKPVLAIEVDGYKFHKIKKQQARDKLKDSILKKVKLPLLRLSTTGSNEPAKITKKLREVLENTN